MQAPVKLPNRTSARHWPETGFWEITYNIDSFLPMAFELPAIDPTTLRLRTECSACFKWLGTLRLAPRVGFEPTACRLTAEMIENLSALSGVAYEKLGAIFPSLVAPTPAPTPMASEWMAVKAQSGLLRWPIYCHFPQRDLDSRKRLHCLNWP